MEESLENGGNLITPALDTPKVKIEEKRKFKPISLRKGLMAIVKASIVNVLLVFVPLGIISEFVGWNSTVVFVLNFLAIIPLAKLLGFATEDLSIRIGEVS